MMKTNFTCIVLTMITGFGLITPLNASAQNGWTQIGDMPVEKWEPSTAVLDGKLYTFGGYTAGVKSSKLNYIFDPKDGSWTRFQDLPSAISHINVVLDGRSVWFAGGFKDGYKDHVIAEVWHYDIDKDRYTAAPLLPEKRGGGGLALIGRNLHFISGIKSDRDTDATDHWVLNLDDWNDGDGKAEWEPRAPIPVGRNQFSCAVVYGKIYCIGGQFYHDKGQIDQKMVDVYDPNTDKWSKAPSLPKGHSHAEGSTFVHKGNIYMLGGHTTADGSTKKIDGDVLRLKPGGKWEVVAKLPVTLSSPAACIIGDKLYVGGGNSDWSKMLIEKRFWSRDIPK
jgi:N-acetylneuraminic acid mutarotase